MAIQLNSKRLQFFSILLVTFYIKSCLTSDECDFLDKLRSTYMSPADKLAMPKLMVSKKMKEHASKLLAQNLKGKKALQGEDSFMVLIHFTSYPNPIADSINHFSRLAGLNKPEYFVNDIRVTPSGNFYCTESDLAGAGGMGVVRIGKRGTKERPEPNQELVAVKSGKVCGTENSIVFEYFLREEEVYKDITAHKIEGICPLLDAGISGNVPILVLRHFRANLNELRIACGGNFILKDIVQIVSAVVDILWDVHLIGWIHRDIKPANIMVEMPDPEGKSKLVLIDFGIAERYLDEKHNNKLLENIPTPASGTAPFMSILTHQMNGPNRREDLEPLLYSILEFLHGYIPWVGVWDDSVLITEKSNFLNNGNIEPFNAVKDHIANLKFETSPEYSYIQETLEDVLETDGLMVDGQFHWDIKLKALFLDRNVLAVGVECTGYESGRHRCVFVFQKFFAPILTKINKIRGKQGQAEVPEVLNIAARNLTANALTITNTQCVFMTIFETDSEGMVNLCLKSLPAEKYKKLKKILKMDSTLYAGFGYNFDKGIYTVGVIFMTGVQLLCFKNGVSFGMPYTIDESNSISQLAEMYCSNKGEMFRKYKSWDVLDAEMCEYKFFDVITHEVFEHKIDNTKATRMEGLEIAFNSLPFAKINGNEFTQIGYATKYIREQKTRQKHLLIVFKFKKYFQEALGLLNSCTSKRKVPKITCSVDEASHRENTGIHCDYFTSTGKNLEEACCNAIKEFDKQFLKKSVRASEITYNVMKSIQKDHPILNLTFYWKLSTNGKYDIGIARDSYTMTLIEEFTKKHAPQTSSKVTSTWTLNVGSETLRKIANSCALKRTNNIKITAEIGLSTIRTARKSDSNTVHGRVLDAISDLITTGLGGQVDNFYPSIVASIAFGYHVTLDGSISAIAVFEYFWHPTFHKINFIRRHFQKQNLNIVFCMDDNDERKKIASIPTTVKSTDGEVIKDTLFSFVETIWEKRDSATLNLLSQPGTRIHFAVYPVPGKKEDTKEWKIEIVLLE